MGHGEHRWSVPAVPAELRGLRRAVGGLLADDGLSDERVHDVLLALSEAATNAVRHGFPTGEPGTIVVVLRLDREGVALEVRDDGVGLGRRSPDPGAGLGRGLLHRLADDVREDEAPGGGARVRMTFRAPA